MLREQLFHGRAVVEEVLDDSDNLVSVFKVRCEPIYVNHDVDEGHAGENGQRTLILLFLAELDKVLQLLVSLVRYLKLQLSVDHFLQLSEHLLWL